MRKKLSTFFLYLAVITALFAISSLLAGHLAFAGTVDTNPMSAQSVGGGELNNFTCSGGENYFLIYIEGTHFQNVPCGFGWAVGGTIFEDFLGEPLDVEVVFCNGSDPDESPCPDISNTVNTTLECGPYNIGPYCGTPAHVSIWGDGNNGFWGSGFTALDVKDQVAGAVGATGNNIYPLFIFAGIPLAFLIFLAVMNFIRQGVPEQKTFDSKRFNKKADELEEFYSRRSRAKAPKGTNWDQP